MIPRPQPGKRTKFELALLLIEWVKKRRKMPCYAEAAIKKALRLAAESRKDGARVCDQREYSSAFKACKVANVIRQASSHEHSPKDWRSLKAFSDDALDKPAAESWWWGTFYILFVFDPK